MIRSKRAQEVFTQAEDVKSKSMSVTQYLEIRKCIDDPAHFIETYVKMQHPTKGIVQCFLHDYQVKQVDMFHRAEHTISVQPRQTGATMIGTMYCLWDALFNDNKHVVISVHKDTSVKDIHDRLTLAFHHLPVWLRPNMVSINRNGFKFENGSKLSIVRGSSNAFRGVSISTLFLDTFAFMKPDEQEDIWNTVAPHMAIGGKMILTSGGVNGKNNAFARIYANAVSGQFAHIVPMRIDVAQCPQFDPGFKARMLAAIGTGAWKREYECDFDA